MRLTGLVGFGYIPEEFIPWDYTPDAFDCPDLSHTDYTGGTAEATGANVTINGVNTEFTTEFNALASPVESSSALLQYSKDNGSFITLASWNGSSWTYSPTNRRFLLGSAGPSHLLKFRVSIDPNPGQVASWNDTITLTNKDDGDATLDTFTVFLESNP